MMDQKRLFLAIALSVVILFGSQLLFPPAKRPVTPAAQTTSQLLPGTTPKSSNTLGVTTQDAGLAPVPTPANTPLESPP